MRARFSGHEHATCMTCKHIRNFSAKFCQKRVHSPFKGKGWDTSLCSLYHPFRSGLHCGEPNPN